jgi:hypothetical protein
MESRWYGASPDAIYAEIDGYRAPLEIKGGAVHGTVSRRERARIT